MGFLRHADLFPDANAPARAEPESGVHRSAKQRKKAAPKRASDLARVPVLSASPREVRATTEDARARWIAPFIDGVSTMDRVLASSALAEEDARAGMQILIDAGLVALR